MTGHAQLGAIFLTLRANGSLDKPVPKIPPAPKLTRQERAMERVFRADHLRIIRDGAQGADLVVRPIKTSSRRFSRTRLTIDGKIYEIHHLTGLYKGAPRCTFQRTAFDQVAAHILLVDLEEMGVLRAYKVSAEYLRREVFRDPERKTGYLRIPLGPNSPMESFKLTWTLSRDPPLEA